MPFHCPVKNTGIYFITFSCHNWFPLIDITRSYDLVYKWFDVMRSLGNEVLAYVIMPNHIHLLLYYGGHSKSLNLIIGNGKRFLAYGIVSRLEADGQHWYLNQLKEAVRSSEKKRGKLHEVWRPSFDVKNCRTEKFVLQKLVYIHNNPCAGKWKLANAIDEYPHSSARFYISNLNSNYPVKDYREFLFPVYPPSLPKP